MFHYEFLLVLFSICDRNKSPLDRCVIPKSLIIREDIVPFPDPGGPMMIERSNRDVIMQ